ncbi:hypothetical protein PR048_026997 [Dryococelus australis]|uniref:Uncharacterized protein n=1 Tax=Dryococelus australis TaxID=614101 RepID=A0ABQ9GMW2_9NEOP|nr:hypothetical protein PR048_026997 [Dryococelus australis]
METQFKVAGQESNLGLLEYDFVISALKTSLLKVAQIALLHFTSIVLEEARQDHTSIQLDEIRDYSGTSPNASFTCPEERKYDTSPIDEDKQNEFSFHAEEVGREDSLNKDGVCVRKYFLLLWGSVNGWLHTGSKTRKEEKTKLAVKIIKDRYEISTAHAYKQITDQERKEEGRNEKQHDKTKEDNAVHTADLQSLLACPSSNTWLSFTDETSHLTIWRIQFKARMIYSRFSHVGKLADVWVFSGCSILPPPPKSAAALTSPHFTSTWYKSS